MVNGPQTRSSPGGEDLRKESVEQAGEEYVALALGLCMDGARRLRGDPACDLCKRQPQQRLPASRSTVTLPRTALQRRRAALERVARMYYQCAARRKRAREEDHPCRPSSEIRSKTIDTTRSASMMTLNNNWCSARGQHGQVRPSVPQFFPGLSRAAGDVVRPSQTCCCCCCCCRPARRAQSCPRSPLLRPATLRPCGQNNRNQSVWCGDDRTGDV